MECKDGKMEVCKEGCKPIEDCGSEKEVKQNINCSLNDCEHLLRNEYISAKKKVEKQKEKAAKAATMLKNAEAISARATACALDALEAATSAETKANNGSDATCDYLLEVGSKSAKKARALQVKAQVAGSKAALAKAGFEDAQLSLAMAVASAAISKAALAKKDGSTKEIEAAESEAKKATKAAEEAGERSSAAARAARISVASAAEAVSGRADVPAKEHRGAATADQGASMELAEVTKHHAGKEESSDGSRPGKRARVA